jgi:putative ABC transport system substrate-binding protein
MEFVVRIPIEARAPGTSAPGRPRRRLGLVSVALLLAVAVPSPAAARDRDQQPEPARFGVLLWQKEAEDLESLAGLRRGLELWRAGGELDVRCAEGDPAEAARLARALRDDGARVLFAVGSPATQAAVAAVPDRPIVFTAVRDPLGDGIVRSLMGSRQNVAGTSDRVDPVEVLALTKLVVPTTSRLGVLRSQGPRSAAAAGEVAQARLARQRPGSIELELVERIVVEAPPRADAGPERDAFVRALESAAAELAREGIDALWLPDDPHVLPHAGRIHAALRRERPAGSAPIPLVASSLGPVRAGDAVAGLSVDREMLAMRAVELAREIVTTGVDPGILPVGGLRAVRIVVHLGAAHADGFEVPLPLLIRADAILGEDVRDGARDATGEDAAGGDRGGRDGGR